MVHVTFPRWVDGPGKASGVMEASWVNKPTIVVLGLSNGGVFLCLCLLLEYLGLEPEATGVATLWRHNAGQSNIHQEIQTTTKSRKEVKRT